MKVFLDTSSLLKLYHKEADTDLLSDALADVESIYLSELARLEFRSAVWKKVRTKEIDSEIAQGIVNYFEDDYPKFNWIKLDSATLNQAISLLNQYGITGLRTLDAIQLSSALSLKGNKEIIFFTHDKLLLSIFEQQGLRK
jgi:predicted nucleic acid-binding protein